MKNTQLSSTLVISNAETGEILFERERKLELPERFFLGNKFYKLGDRAIETMSNNHLGSLCKLAKYIEYGTNRLTISGVGKNPIVIRQKHMAEILGVSQRSITYLVKHLFEYRAIFKIKGAYYVNPTFAIRSTYISTKHFEEMLKLDPEIRINLKEWDKTLVNQLERAEIAKWHIEEAEEK